MNTSLPTVHIREEIRGFTLIEVLVALAVLAIGLLGMAALQVTGMKFNTDAYTRTQSTFAAYDIIDRMRLNTAGLNAGNYDVSGPTFFSSKVSSYDICKSSTCNCDITTCDASNLALYDIGRWYNEGMLGKLPDPTGTIIRNAGIVTVTVSWRDRELNIRKSQTWQVQL